MHRPFRADEWMLYACDSPAAFGARGFVRGQVFSRDGTLVASVAQEGLVRMKAPRGPSAQQAQPAPPGSVAP
jgi:acyl-CoA thioesterase-2